MAEVGDRPMEFDVGLKRSMLYIVWQVLKALPSYLFRSK
jgi:hypothetical protein